MCFSLPAEVINEVKLLTSTIRTAGGVRTLTEQMQQHLSLNKGVCRLNGDST